MKLFWILIALSFCACGCPGKPAENAKPAEKAEQPKEAPQEEVKNNDKEAMDIEAKKEEKAEEKLEKKEDK